MKNSLGYIIGCKAVETILLQWICYALKVLEEEEGEKAK